MQEPIGRPRMLSYNQLKPYGMKMARKLAQKKGILLDETSTVAGFGEGQPDTALLLQHGCSML